MILHVEMPPIHTKVKSQIEISKLQICQEENLHIHKSSTCFINATEFAFATFSIQQNLSQGATVSYPKVVF